MSFGSDNLLVVTDGVGFLGLHRLRELKELGSVHVSLPSSFE
jgi:hypothetical protein